jgi:hypothetical protein
LAGKAENGGSYNEDGDEDMAAAEGKTESKKRGERSFSFFVEARSKSMCSAGTNTSCWDERFVLRPIVSS